MNTLEYRTAEIDFHRRAPRLAAFGSRSAMRLLVGWTLILQPLAGCGEDDKAGSQVILTGNADAKDTSETVAQADVEANDGVDAVVPDTGDAVTIDGAEDAAHAQPCVEHADCPGIARLCVEGKCVAGPACSSDKTCIGYGAVCVKALGSCAPCAVDADCGSGQTCEAWRCVGPPTPCSSSKDCAAEGKICDKTGGSCVVCVTVDDCTNGETCYQSHCAAKLCEPGVLGCSDTQTQWTCDANALTKTSAACGAGDFCAIKGCEKTVCTAGETRCEAGGLQTCEASGLGWGTAMTCPSGQACIGKSCQAAVCVPGSSECKDGGVAICAADGAAWKQTPCAGATACQIQDGKAGCAALLCSPGSKACQGEVVKICAADGLSASPGEDCGNPGPGGAAQVCLGGKCVPAGCMMGATSCADDGALLTCKNDGSGWTPSGCGEGKTCVGGQCVAQSCVPGKSACAGALVMVCNMNGTDQEIAQDCAIASDACGAGVCDAGGCTVAPKSCDDGKVCTVDVCEASKGCTHSPGSGVCEDGDACTEGDACAEGVCKAGATKSCDDGNPCTTDACVAAKGCTNEAGADGASCSGVAGGVCKLGQCVASCPFGYEAVEIDKGGVKGISCAAVQQVWGLRPESTAGLLKVETIGGGKVLVDSGTGMMWEPGVVQGDKNWHDAGKACDQLVHAGFEDWRLPTLWEAVALMDWASAPGKGCFAPVVFDVWGAGTVASENWWLTFWTSTLAKLSKQNYPGKYPFFVTLLKQISCGATPHGSGESKSVRCVRTQQTIEANPARFTVTASGGDAVVSDGWTKRDWLQANSTSPLTYQAAQGWCSSMKVDGGGWRLPGFRELYSLFGNSSGLGYFDATVLKEGSKDSLSTWTWTTTKGNKSDTNFTYRVVATLLDPTIQIVTNSGSVSEAGDFKKTSGGEMPALFTRCVRNSK